MYIGGCIKVNSPGYDNPVIHKMGKFLKRAGLASYDSWEAGLNDRTLIITMVRTAFKMKLKPGYEAEYKRRHDEIWPELERHWRKPEYRIIPFILIKRRIPYLQFKSWKIIIKPINLLRIPGLKNGGHTWLRSWKQTGINRRLALNLMKSFIWIKMMGKPPNASKL